MKTFCSKVVCALLFAGVLGAGAAAAAPTGVADNAYSFYLKALLLESQGNFEAARTEIEKASELAPESAYVHRTLAELYLRLGQTDKAAASIERANELDPKDSKALVIAGQIYWAKGDAEKAEAKLKQALVLDPDGTEALVNLAGAVTPKDPKRAIRLYKDFLARHPGEVEIQEQVAQLYQGLGDIDNAKAAWQQALGWSPNSLRAHLALAQIAEVNYDTATAISHYEAVLTEDPSNLPLLLRIGELRYRNNEMAKAYEAFSRAQAISPTSASANFWLALLAEHRGDWNEAIRLLKQVDGKTHDPGVSLRLSYYYSQIGKYKDAIKILKTLADSDPSNQDFLNYLSIAYEEDNQLSNAEKTLHKLIDLDPNDPENHFHLATLYDRMKLFDKAEPELKRSIALKPDYDVALNYLGYSYADHGVKLDEAERLVNDAIALDPESGAYLDSMGWVYYKQGKLQKAEDFLREATQRARDPLIWAHVGDVKRAQAEFEEAILAWDEALRADPQTDGVAKKIQQALAKLSPQQRLDLFLKRAINDFGDVQAMNGFIQVSVCQKKPCFEGRARLSYARDGEMRVEIPGPLSGPLMLLKKTHGRPSTYGAIHPLFQTMEFYVTRAFDRVEAVLSADAFRGLDLKQLDENISEKHGSLTAASPESVVEFESKRGFVQCLTWKGQPDEDSLTLSGYGEGRSVSLPTRMEWLDKKSGVTIRIDLVNPSLTFSPAASDEPVDDDPAE